MIVVKNPPTNARDIRDAGSIPESGRSPGGGTPTAAAAAAKSLQSCPTLCDPIDGRLPRPWDSLGKNTGVGCHFLLQCIKVKREREVTQSCLTLSDRMDYSLPGSSIHGILQARVLEWGAIALSDTSTRMIKIQNADKTTCC